MKKTYEQVLKQIEVLQAEAENLRRSEVAGVIERIRSAIAHYKLTAAEALRRLVWNPTLTIGGGSRALWACGQAAFEPVHMSTGRL